MDEIDEKSPRENCHSETLLAWRRRVDSLKSMRAIYGRLLKSPVGQPLRGASARPEQNPSFSS
jgi:hypothetical protein